MPWESWTAGQCSAAAEWHQGVKEARLLGEAGLVTIELRPDQGVKTLAKAPRGWNDMAVSVRPMRSKPPPGRGALQQDHAPVSHLTAGTRKAGIAMIFGKLWA